MSNHIQKAALIGFSCLLLVMAEAAQTCQTASIPATTPTSQLTDNADGTVTDTKTGLMWKQCAEGLSGSGCLTGAAQAYTWSAALNQVQTVNLTGGFAGYTDWRLPNIKELRSIIEKQCYAPAINLTRFPNTAEYAVFWSSSPVAGLGSYAWLVGFGSGSDGWSNKYRAFQVRLVRSGQ